MLRTKTYSLTDVRSALFVGLKVELGLTRTGNPTHSNR